MISFNQINFKPTLPSFRQRGETNQPNKKKSLNINKTVHRYGPMVEYGVDSIVQKFENVRSMFSSKQISVSLSSLEKKREIFL